LNEACPYRAYCAILALRLAHPLRQELGYRLTKGFGISVFLDHISNGNLAHHNEGVTNLGMRAGFFF
jgi:lipid A 3-O-deacylase PagL